jgi:hypothetical protein
MQHSSEYVAQVEARFAREQPEVTEQFMALLSSFKSKTIERQVVIARVQRLFVGHPDLLQGFTLLFAIPKRTQLLSPARTLVDEAQMMPTGNWGSEGAMFSNQAQGTEQNTKPLANEREPHSAHASLVIAHAVLEASRRNIALAKLAETGDEQGKWCTDCLQSKLLYGSTTGFTNYYPLPLGIDNALQHMLGRNVHCKACFVLNGNPLPIEAERVQGVGITEMAETADKLHCFCGIESGGNHFSSVPYIIVNQIILMFSGNLIDLFRLYVELRQLRNFSTRVRVTYKMIKET